LKENKRKIEEAKDLLIKATRLLTEVIEMAESNGTEAEEWMKQRMELWVRIYLEGGVVAQERLHEIWGREMNKDVRGLGGFFVGKRASLEWTHDNRVMLTRYATESIEAWTGKSVEEYAKLHAKKPKGI
jgi:hypothetical protein